MARQGKSREAPAKNDSSGAHGGNRAGGTKRLEAQTAKRTSQSAGKDPDRGKRAKRPSAN